MLCMEPGAIHSARTVAGVRSAWRIHEAKVLDGARREGLQTGRPSYEGSEWAARQGARQRWCERATAPESSSEVEVWSSPRRRPRDMDLRSSRSRKVSCGLHRYTIQIAQTCWVSEGSGECRWQLQRESERGIASKGVKGSAGFAPSALLQVLWQRPRGLGAPHTCADPMGREHEGYATMPDLYGKRADGGWTRQAQSLQQGTTASWTFMEMCIGVGAAAANGGSRASASGRCGGWGNY